MADRELRITRIGNSRGIRIPAETLHRYGIGDSVVMEERADGIFLRPSAAAVEKLSWEETAQEMAAAREDWSECDVVDADGLESSPWNPEGAGARRVPESGPQYKARPHKKKRS